MKNIKSSDELSWFNINNYSQVSSWSREKLAIELTARTHLRRIEEHLIDPFENESFSRLLNNIHETGEAFPERSIYFDDTPRAYVMQLQLWQLESMTNNILEELEDSSASYFDTYDDVSDSSKFIHLTINTSGDPEIIQRELNMLIEQFKQQKRPPIVHKTYKNNDIDKIKNTGVIPISDIYFWCLLKRKTIIPSLIVELISPDIRVTSKQITQTVSHTIRDIFKEKMYISELRVPHQ